MHRHWKLRFVIYLFMDFVVLYGGIFIVYLIMFIKYCIFDNLVVRCACPLGYYSGNLNIVLNYIWAFFASFMPYSSFNRDYRLEIPLKKMRYRVKLTGLVLKRRNEIYLNIIELTDIKCMYLFLLLHSGESINFVFKIYFCRFRFLYNIYC